MSIVTETHRYQLISELQPDDFQRLKDSIIERGIEVPIVVDENGEILDGHHRKMIADSLGIECPVIVRRDLSEAEKRIYAVELNVARRHMTEGQKVLLGQKIEPDIAKVAEARRLAALKRDNETPLVTNVTNGDYNQNKTSAQVAKSVGLGSHMTYERGKKLLDELAAQPDGEQLKHHIETGDWDLSDARKELRTRKAEQRVSEIAQKSNAPMPEVDRTYPVIYADPPWRYDFSSTDNRKIENQYPTMSIDEIAALEVPAADDAVLFMWATNPKLEEAFKVLKGWGFTYVTNMVWVKDKIGMGYYARSRHELLLIAKRGELPVPLPANRPDSVIEGKRAEHSAKPLHVYRLIESMYPDFPKIELFSRSPQDGWAAWGNQAW